MNKQKITLAIDTSCDETAVAVTCGLEVWSNVVASQVDLHRPYGGVFPTIAKQAHRENLQPAVKLALGRAGLNLSEIEQIAVTQGPGLAPALEVGIKYAQSLGEELAIEVHPINHIEGHILSVLAVAEKRAQRKTVTERTQTATKITQEKLSELKLPALAIIVSGGHSQFVLIETAELRTTRLNQDYAKKFDRAPRLSVDLSSDSPSLVSGLFRYTILGQTIDDAAGEALDKIGRILNLGYPAGPVIEQLAKAGNSQRYKFPLPMTQSRDFNLSFSGLKTHARNFVKAEWGDQAPSKEEVVDLCASAQFSIFRHICYKLSKLIEHQQLNVQPIQEYWLGGGVAANAELRKMLRSTIRQQMKKSGKSATPPPLRAPYSKKLCGDNAAMIGVVNLTG